MIEELYAVFLNYDKPRHAAHDGFFIIKDDSAAPGAIDDGASG